MCGHQPYFHKVAALVDEAGSLFACHALDCIGWDGDLMGLLVNASTEETLVTKCVTDLSGDVLPIHQQFLQGETIICHPPFKLQNATVFVCHMLYPFHHVVVVIPLEIVKEMPMLQKVCDDVHQEQIGEVCLTSVGYLF